MKAVLLMLTLLLTSFASVQPDQSKRIFVSEGDSMVPTINNEDRFLVDKTYYDSHPIQRGDIVIFQAEKNRQFVKRVIGLPGESLEYRNDILYIDSKATDEPYLASVKNEAQEQNLMLTEDFRPITIPEDAIFVLGDNRLNSLDSRMMGPVPFNQIIGKMTIKLPSK
ncbi:signal peptidase I [Brevibacillus reuszeri]|uniref:signal peptidase I n=1 Tax=Brevibacillus reuszeri TaxID=54915 RepID=UPI0028A1146C|nr:signal peptidase I [Brevibacillus reuszeri]